MRYLVGLLIVWSSLFCNVIAVASDDDSLASSISSKASRCNYYIFIDKDGKILEVLQNSNKDIKGGASSKLIELLNEKKVSHFVASNLGDKLMMSLDANKIKYTVYKGSIDAFIREKL